MSRYTQLTREQRYRIYALKKAGHTQTQIANTLGVHKSTISRELGRNRGGKGYRPKQAHKRALERRRANSAIRVTQDTWELIERLLREDWSPEQISLWLKAKNLPSVSHEWIYQHIIRDKRRGGTLHRHLRCQKKRKKRYGAYERRGQMPNRISIDERPAAVERRERLGDWEVDTIIGKGHKQAIVSLTERKSRLSLISKVQTKGADEVGDAILTLLEPLAERVLTITSDNGKEFARHKNIAKTLNAEFYFAHPYASWERGLNENTNGLIRQYFPKGYDFSSITYQEIQAVMDKLNNRPRKCLGMNTPNQVFFNINPSVALQS